MTYAFMRGLMRFMTRTFLVGLFKVEGLENVPRQGPLVVCANHFATLDPPMVPAFLPRADTWNMAKSEYFRKPLMRWIFTRYHAFPVVRHSADRAALRRAFDLLKAGEVLIIYPEGTRVESGELATPEPGAGFIAQKAGCPVLPVALTGTRECLPKGARWPRRVPVTLRFGEPFLLPQRRPNGERISHEEASDAIMLAIAELLPPENRGRYRDVESWRRKLEGVASSR
ncbi:MAG: 1-acyl-sn-glycerol-3-phosphate acyltransferase [Chloroflexi bacterium]|nr:MAG: 1-acyl-sn-glycerol-3-phosphate acyltransferase [Chloroflexota bacterium]TMF17243.1 MAG: 1-acyl-sn-glycerol-3-phosphate acyltransferase [Chloroflexota bacterium]